MGGWDNSVRFRYGIAVIGVLFAAALRAIMDPFIGERAAYTPFTLVVLITVLWCGPGAAIMASILSLGFGFLFAQSESVGIGDFAQSVVFLVTAGGIITVGEIANTLRRELMRSHQEAQRRAAQFALAAEELNLLIDGTPGLAIYMLDPYGRIMIWNKGAERLSGWKEEEVLGTDASILYPATDKCQVDLSLARSEGRIEGEGLRRRKDGTTFLASFSITTLYDEQGKLRGFAKIVSDITRRRADEKALLARESLLTSILSTVPDAMVVIDAHGVVLSFSDAAQTLFGYDACEVIGHNISMLMPAPDSHRHDLYLRRYLETGEKRIIGKGRVVFAQRKDGTTFPVTLSIGEARDGEQHIFTGFLQDLTERHQVQERLETLQSELIHVARISAMGAMASTLAHELNQPIAAVVNYVQAAHNLMGGPQDWDLVAMREALDDAARNALRAGQIVRRLRAFVTLGTIERTVEALPALINEACVLALMGAREQGIHTYFELGPEALAVLVDRIQIQQVMVNLIRNACEAMTDSPERRLRIETHPYGTDFVRVTISDSGTGVPTAIHDQLFKAFYSTKQEGMGLGLSICRTIIEAHEGKIWLETREGRGTSFHFTLPRAK
ncbi:MAG: PAS domain-containing sensor histidine kinase [Novosphingobium sp. SCN 63-17]|nr:MAG: PAS domain-containing sensor histidine kinase [Novosphingobium sp. SCN 63-17]OJX93490.1 MAG: PAS domain-containing sensor histidine kinase [Novosphingobium sp. 63-713]